MRTWRTAHALRRAFLIVLALRYLPTGLLLPVFVLLMLDRGLSLAQVGVAVAAQGAVILILEIPTGGLADAVGSRVILAAAGVCAVLGTGLLLAAHDLAGFLLAWAVIGVYRALDSGPLEAWYVNAALATDPNRDLERDLSIAGVVTYTAMALGAASASVAAVLPPLRESSAATAVLIGLVLEGVHLVAVLALVREDRPRRRVAVVLHQVLDTGSAIAAGARTAWRARPLRLVLLVELGWGAGLAGVELLWQPRLDQVITGGHVTAVTGLIAAAGLAAGALGAAALPWMLHRVRGRLALTATLLLVLQAGAVLTLGLLGLAGVVIGYVAFYTVHGSLNAAHAALLHRRTPSGHRATVLSLNSLVSRTGALPAGIALGALADRNWTWAFLATAGLLLAAAPLYTASGENTQTQAPNQQRVRPDDDQPAPFPLDSKPGDSRGGGSPFMLVSLSGPQREDDALQ